MKTQSILKLAVASLVILALAGCRKEKPAPQPEPPRPQPEVPEFTEGLTVVADYYGDAYGVGYDDYELYFQIGAKNSDGAFAADGIELALDILVAEGSAVLFPGGKYYLTDGSYRSAGILPSIPTTLKEYLLANGMSLEGYSAAELASVYSYGNTSFYVQESPDKWWLAAVDKAELEVTVNGAEYTFEVKFEAGGDSYTYKYKGPLTICDRREDPPTNVPNRTMEGINNVYAYNYGHIWGDDTDDWFIYLYNDTNEWLEIEFVSDTQDGGLPTGTFRVPADFFDVEKIPARAPCPLYFDEYDECYYGTYYAQDDAVVLGATDGSLQVSAVGDNYKLNLLFYDEEVDEYFELKYTGAIEVNYEDYVTTATKSMQQRPARGRRPATKLLRSTKIRPGSGARRMVL